MHKYLPSKRFALLIVSVILALLIIYVFSFLKKPEPKKYILTETETQNKVQEFMALDTDNDGLKDWEEALWKTDPQKKDTDGDGTSDSDEINLNRDPLKQNINPSGQEPSDKIDPEKIIASKKAEEEYKNLTITEKISRDLFSQYIATRKLDKPLSETDKLLIIENALSNLPTITFKTYTEKDITVLNLADNNTLVNYSNAVAELILNTLKNPAEGMETILNDFSNIEDDTKIEEKTKEIFKRFDPLIANNHKILTGLLNISTPAIIVPEHLSVINSFQEIYEILSLIQESATDIVILLPLLNNYYQSVDNLTNSLISLDTKLSTLNITYQNKTDYGYKFFNVIMLK